MNKNTIGPLVVVLVGVAGFGTLLAFFTQPISCGCNGSSSPSSPSSPWYPCVQNPCPHATLNLDSDQFNSSTNVTLNIRWEGVDPVALIAYYVTDSNGAQYANSNWRGPTIPPAAVVSVNILIDGTTFTFQKGYSYTVTVVTSRNDQYGFTITY